MTRKTPATTLLAIGAFVATASSAFAESLPVCPVVNGETVNYDLLRGGSVFGHQTVRYGVAGPDLTVTIDVTAALHVLGVRVYHYLHHGEERWHNGQMVSLVTRTDDDGIPRHVDANRDPQTGLWSGTTGLQPGTAPLMSTSLWNIQTIVQTRMLDRETGAVIAVHTSPAGDEMLRLGPRQVNAGKYDSVGVVKGSVWYDGRGCWVQAVFHTRVDGSLIEIRAQ